MTKTNRDLALTLWGSDVVIPEGTRLTLIKNADGVKGDQWAVADVGLLKRLTGNSHDPVYRYAFVPDDAVTQEIASHTPGPWHRNIKPVSRYPIVFAGRSTHVAQICTSGLDPEEAEANCQLVTEAPTMLAALRLIAEYAWPDTGKGSRIHQAAWKAIEAATGETFDPRKGL